MTSSFGEGARHRIARIKVQRFGVFSRISGLSAAPDVLADWLWVVSEQRVYAARRF